MSLAPHAEGQVIVSYDQVNHDAVLASLTSLGYTFDDNFTDGASVYLFDSSSKTTQEAIDEISTIQFVNYAEPNYILTIAGNTPESVDCSDVAPDCRSTISQLIETAEILDDDQFLISTLVNQSPTSRKVGFAELKQKIVDDAVQASLAAITVTPNSPGWTSGWVDRGEDQGDGLTPLVENNSILTFTHALSTTDFVVSLFLAADDSGQGAHILHQFHQKTDSGFTGFGAGITSINDQTIQVQLGADGYFQLSNGGVNSVVQNFSGNWIKVVIKTI